MMDLEASKTKLRAAFADFGRGDPSGLLGLFAPEVVYTVIGKTPFSGTYRGLEKAMTHLFAPLAAALATPIVLDVRHLVGEGDRIVMQAEGRATLRSGAPYTNVYAFVFRFADDRIVEVTEYLDTAHLAQAFGVPAERDDLFRLMDLNTWEMYREIVRVGRGGELVEHEAFTMASSPNGNFFHNMVMVRDGVDAEPLLAAVRENYVARNRPFSIWVRPHADQALAAALAERGFMNIVTLPAMVLLGDPGTRCKPDGLEIRRVTDDRGRQDYLEVTAEAYAVYQQPREMTEDAFASLASVCQPHVQAFLGYVGGEAVAAAAVYMTHGVAGIGWVGTREAQRGRRYAEAVTWAAVREGFRRGATFANLQASPMGRPVYERMGFLTPTEYHVLVGTP